MDFCSAGFLKQPMKNKLLLFLSLCALLSIAKSGSVPPAQITETAYESALQINFSEFETLTAAFHAAHSESTFGGLVSKSALWNVVNSMPSSAQYINFRFCTDGSNISLMLMGGKSWYEGTKKIPCIRNGGSEESFCPINCELNSTAQNITLQLPYSEYLERSEAYSAQNSGGTFGGNLDKEAMRAILKSLPESEINVAFRFCVDPVFHKLSVIFVGGTFNQPENKQLFIRNGKDEFSFCPAVCGVRD